MVRHFTDIFRKYDLAFFCIYTCWTGPKFNPFTKIQVVNFYLNILTYINKGDNFSRNIASSSFEKSTLFSLSKRPCKAEIVSANILTYALNGTCDFIGGTRSIIKFMRHNLLFMDISKFWKRWNGDVIFGNVTFYKNVS